MADDHTAFTGSVPDHYDSYLGPLLFQPYAEDIAARLRSRQPMRVLELACGTGIVTRVLRDTLRVDAALVATDLNETMIERARSKFHHDEAVQWRQADATRLPFADGSFDAVICQFGLMFFPDKQAAMNEVHRVLEPGGVFLFSVWDSVDQNELSAVADRAIADFFPGNPPDFYTIPFGCHDREEIRSLCERAGFVDMETSAVSKTSVIDSATEAARGLVEGTPVAGQILQRHHSDLSAIVDSVAERIRATFGDHPVRSMMTAVVCEAHRGKR